MTPRWWTVQIALLLLVGACSQEARVNLGDDDDDNVEIPRVENLQAFPGDRKVALTWELAAGTIAARVERDGGDGNGFVEVIAVTQSPYVDDVDDQVNPATVTYRVRALDSTSTPSFSVSTGPVTTVAPGDLDPFFAAGPDVFTGGGTMVEARKSEGHGLVELDGFIHLVGMEEPGTNQEDALVKRFDAKGEIEYSVLIDAATAGDLNHARSVALGPPNPPSLLVAAQTALSGGTSNALYRIDAATGALDNTFSMDGRVLFGTAMANNRPNDVLRTSNGGIAVVGLRVPDSGNDDMDWWLRNPSGGPASDDSIDSGQIDEFHGIAEDLDTNVLYSVGARAGMFYLRTTAVDLASGETLTNYGTGTAFDVVAGSSPPVCGDSGGALIVGGSGSELYMLCVESNNGGQLDQDGFGVMGRVRATETEAAEGHSIAVDGLRRILVAGVVGANMAVWRFTGNGDRDDSFGTDGVAVFAPVSPAPNAVAQSILVATDGAIVVTGYYGDTVDHNLVVWRIAP